MKKIIKWMKWPFIMGIFILIGMLISLVIAETFHKTKTSDFCAGCHVMEPMVETWSLSVHGGNNTKGIVAECGDCHTDQRSALSYTYSKTFLGLTDMLKNKLNRPTAEDFLKEHDASQNVFDTGCLKCHKKIADSVSVAEDIRNIHKAYFDNRKNPYMQCSRCHKSEIAHPGLEDLLKKRAFEEDNQEK